MLRKTVFVEVGGKVTKREIVRSGIGEPWRVPGLVEFEHPRGEAYAEVNDPVVYKESERPLWHVSPLLLDGERYRSKGWVE